MCDINIKSVHLRALALRVRTVIITISNYLESNKARGIDEILCAASICLYNH